MKLFLKKIVLVALVSFLFGLLLTLGVLSVCSNGKNFKISKEIDTIILGHSHSACAFNDSLLQGVYNLSQPTEGYPYTYYKAKKLLESNDHIETIYVEYVNNQISPWACERIYGEYLSINMPRMAAVMDKKHILKTLYKSPDLRNISETVTQSFKKGLGFLVNNETNYVEHFWHTHMTPSHMFDGDSAEIKGPTGERFIDIYTIQRENLGYLFKLKELCSEHGINLIFTRSPLPKHVNFSNEETFQNIKNTFFPKVPFLDFKNFSLELKYFSDNQHLNYQGGVIFSEYFRDKILTKE